MNQWDRPDASRNVKSAARQAWGFDERKARTLDDSADADPSMPDALEAAASLDQHFYEPGRH